MLTNNQVACLVCVGTPAGVGAVQPGNKITAGLEVDGNELARLDFSVKLRENGLFKGD